MTTPPAGDVGHGGECPLREMVAGLVQYYRWDADDPEAESLGVADCILARLTALGIEAGTVAESEAPTIGSAGDVRELIEQVKIRARCYEGLPAADLEWEIAETLERYAAALEEIAALGDNGGMGEWNDGYTCGKEHAAEVARTALGQTSEPSQPATDEAK